MTAAQQHAIASTSDTLNFQQSGDVREIRPPIPEDPDIVLIKDLPNAPLSVALPRTAPSTAAGSSFVLIDLATLGFVIMATLALAANATGSETLGQMLLFGGTVQVGLKTWLGLYPGFGLHPDARLRRSVAAWAGAGGVAIGAILYLVPMNWFSFSLFCSAFVACGLLQALCRRILRTILVRIGSWGVPVHLTGTPETVAKTSDYLKAHLGIGFRPVDKNTPADTVLWAGHDFPSSTTLDALRRGQQDIIVVSDLPRCRLSGVHPAEHGGKLGLHLALTQKRSLTSVNMAKRAFDLALAIPLVLIALPIVTVAAALIWIVDPGQVFYVQPREGHGGKTIGVLKLRTMYLNAEKMLQDLLAHDPDVKAEWEAHFKLRKDPRILPFIGAFLRASSLDELPQLLNILRGDMSLVGPRPFPDYHLEAMPSEFRSRRASVIPGLTGLWQISERSSADLEGQQELDDYYINGRSFWGDVSILLRTFAAVLGRRGAY